MLISASPRRATRFIDIGLRPRLPLPKKLEKGLRFEEGYEEAREWLQDAATQDELDSLCLSAREAKNEAA
jgi:hypothetical protein